MGNITEEIAHKIYELIYKQQNGGTVNPKPGTPEYQEALRKRQGEIKPDHSTWASLVGFERDHPVASAAVDMTPIVGHTTRYLKASTPTERQKILAEAAFDLGFGFAGAVRMAKTAKSAADAASLTSKAAYKSKKAAEWAAKADNVRPIRTKGELQNSYLYNYVHPKVKNNYRDYDLLTGKTSGEVQRALLQDALDRKARAMTNSQFYTSAAELAAAKAAGAKRAAAQQAIKGAVDHALVAAQPNTEH